jgi:hypothetical protein
MSNSSNILKPTPRVDISRVNIASGASGYSTIPKGVSSGEIGRMILAKSAEQSRVDIELVLKGDEFDAVWELTTGQKIQKVIATLVCFQLKQANPAPTVKHFLLRELSPVRFG